MNGDRQMMILHQLLKSGTIRFAYRSNDYVAIKSGQSYVTFLWLLHTRSDQFTFPSLDGTCWQVPKCSSKANWPELVDVPTITVIVADSRTKYCLHPLALAI